MKAELNPTQTRSIEYIERICVSYTSALDVKTLMLRQEIETIIRHI